MNLQFTQGIPQNLTQIPQQSFQQPQQGFSQPGYAQQFLLGRMQPVQQQPAYFVQQQPQQQALTGSQQGSGQWVYIQQPQQAFVPHQQMSFITPQQQQLLLEQQQQQAGQQFLQPGQPQFGQAPLAYAPQVQQELGGQAGQFASAGMLGMPHHISLAAMRKGPKNYARSDERIREVICECLIQDMTLDVGDITIDVQKGCVSLSGTVPDRHMKYCIEDIVDKCWGVQEIENDLHVRPCEDTGLSAGDTGHVSMQQSGGGFASATGTSRVGSSAEVRARSKE
jgi:osmotically-inducible protein OsmY